jgi:hypothetical protein
VESGRRAVYASDGDKKVLSLDHTDTLNNASDLSSLLEGQGKYKEAEMMHPHVRKGGRISERAVLVDEFSDCDDTRSLDSLKPSLDSASLTAPSSLSYGAAAEMGQKTENRSSTTFFNHKKLTAEDRPDERNDDIDSVASASDDVESLVDSNSGAGNYRYAAANYIAKEFIKDSDLLALYQESNQVLDATRFLRNHRRLLKMLYLDLRSEANGPSQTLAIRFLRARSARRLISLRIRGFVTPSDDTLREKINVVLMQDKENLFQLDRWMAEQDSAAQQAHAEEYLSGNSHMETGSEASEDNDEYEADNSTLSKLKATAEFLTTGRPFDVYKERVRTFLHPTLEEATLPENVVALRSDSVETNSSFPPSLPLFVDMILRRLPLP